MKVRQKLVYGEGKNITYRNSLVIEPKLELHQSHYLHSSFNLLESTNQIDTIFGAIGNYLSLPLRTSTKT